MTTDPALHRSPPRAAAFRSVPSKMTSFTRILAGLVFLASALSSSGCVSRSTVEDVRSARSAVHERAPRLDLASLETTSRKSDEEAVDPDARALTREPLTVESAIRIALLNNRDLRAELLELGVARGQLVQASLFPNPDFEAQARFSRDPAQDAQWDFGIGIDLTEILLRALRTAVARADLDAARLRAAGATLDLGYQVRLAFYDMQAEQQRLELIETSLDAFAASYDTARALHEVGNLTDLDLVTEQAAYEDMRVAVAEAESEREAARERLNTLLGLFGREATWTIPARLDPPHEQESEEMALEKRAIESRLELATTRASLEAAARRVGLVETTGWLPDLNIGVHAEHDGTFWEMGPALTGTLPVFNRQQGNLISQRAEFDALRQRYVAEAVTLRATLRIVRARKTSAEARALHYQSVILPLRERVVHETLLQYNAMQVGVFQLLQARRDQMSTAHAYVTTLHDYWRSRAALEQLLAGRSTGTLVAPSAPRGEIAARSGARGGH